MSENKTHMTLSSKECSGIVDSIEMWSKLLNGIFLLNPITHNQYLDLRYNKIPELKRQSWYVAKPR